MVTFCGAFLVGLLFGVFLIFFWLYFVCLFYCLFVLFSDHSRLLIWEWMGKSLQNMAE